MIQTAMLVAILAIQPAAAQERTGAITGTIRSVSGDLAARVRVTAVMTEGSIPDKAGTAISAITETGADGSYRLTNMPPGAYYIMAGHPETPTYYPGVKGRPAARVLLARAGGTLADVDFALAPPLSVSGRVGGIPLSLSPSLVRVLMNRSDRPDTTIRETGVGPDGSFEFTNVAPGDYSLFLRAPGLDSKGTAISVRATDVRGLEILWGNDPLAGYRAKSVGHQFISRPVVGAVTGQTPFPAKIQLTDGFLDCACFLADGSIQTGVAEIDSTGHFSFPGVMPGLYSVRVSSSSLVPLSLPQLRVSQVVNSNTASEWAASWPAQIRLPAITNIPGRIVVEGGRPLPEQVRVNIQGGIVAGTESDGRFTLPLAEGGQYALFLTGLPQGYEVRSILQAGRDLRREALKVEEGAAPAEIVVTLTSANGGQ